MLAETSSKLNFIAAEIRLILQRKNKIGSFYWLWGPPFHISRGNQNEIGYSWVGLHFSSDAFERQAPCAQNGNEYLRQIVMAF